MDPDPNSNNRRLKSVQSHPTQIAEYSSYYSHIAMVHPNCVGELVLESYEIRMLNIP